MRLISKRVPKELAATAQALYGTSSCAWWQLRNGVDAAGLRASDDFFSLAPAASSIPDGGGRV